MRISRWLGHEFWRHPGVSRDPVARDSARKSYMPRGRAALDADFRRHDDEGGRFMHGERKYGGYFYILASRRNGTLYKGVTNDLVRRIAEHKEGKTKGFTSRYKVHSLVYYEVYDRIEDAIRREKQVGEWQRDWKLELVENMNPEWRDLYEDVMKL